MKDYTVGRIFCGCSIRMHCRGKLIKIYENTYKKQRCPNCGKKRKIMVTKQVAKTTIIVTRKKQKRKKISAI